jgi:DNA-directed RNA polymerase subunit E'/Rpb7
MKLISPYRIINQKAKILLEPYHMNSDIKTNMKAIVKKLEKKCNDIGYIDEIYCIISSSGGYMPPENLNAGAIYNIIYQCKICIPVVDRIIIGQVRVINQELIVAINGPIMFFIPKENIDSNIWDISDGYLNKNNKKKLLLGDYIKIYVMDKRINQNANQIKSIGGLLDLPTEEEIETYFGNKVITNDITDSISQDPNYENPPESNFIL